VALNRTASSNTAAITPTKKESERRHVSQTMNGQFPSTYAGFLHAWPKKNSQAPTQNDDPPKPHSPVATGVQRYKATEEK
jgi:hypothetical protein